MATKTSSSWQIESLFKKAFAKTKDRFFSFIFVYLIGIGIGLAAGLGVLLVAGILFLVFQAVKVPALIVFLGVVVGVAFIAILIYLGSWVQLTTFSIMTEGKKLSVNDTMKKMRPLVPGYIWLGVASALFIFGLIPFGIVTVFIIMLVWAVWGAFAGFVYLYQKQPKGLQSLWISKEMVRGNFWKVAGRMFLVVFAIGLVNGLFSASGSDLLNAIAPLISLVSGPFVIAYLYEMYKGLPAPKAVKTPGVWVGLSVFGWLLMLVFFVLLGTLATTMIGQLMNNKTVKPFPNSFERNFVPPVR